MANTATVVQVPSGAPLGAGGVYIQGPGDLQDPALVLRCTIVSDGAATGVITVNWIDGVQTLPFVPSMVRAHMTQLGTATSGALAVDNGGLLGAAARVSAITNVSFGLNVATIIGTNGQTAVVFVEVFK